MSSHFSTLDVLKFPSSSHDNSLLDFQDQACLVNVVFYLAGTELFSLVWRTVPGKIVSYPPGDVLSLSSLHSKARLTSELVISNFRPTDHLSVKPQVLVTIWI